MTAGAVSGGQLAANKGGNLGVKQSSWVFLARDFYTSGVQEPLLQSNFRAPLNDLKLRKIQAGSITSNARSAPKFMDVHCQCNNTFSSPAHEAIRAIEKGH